MSFKEKFNGQIDEGYKAINSAFVNPIQGFVQSWQQLRSRDSRYAYFIITILFLFTILSFLVSYKFLISNSVPNTTNQVNSSIEIKQSKPQSEITSVSGIGGSELDNDEQGQKRAKVGYLNFFNSLTAFFGNYFGQYVFQTVDPTGLSTIDSTGGGVTFYPVVNTDTKLKMGTNNFLFTTIRYSNVLLAIVAPIMAVLIVMTGLQIIMNSNNSSHYGELSQRIQRLVMCGVMVFLITPALLSFSVMSTQLLNNQILTLVGKQNSTNPECVNEPPQNTKCIFSGITDQLITKKSPAIDLADPSTQGSVDIPSWDIGGIIVYQARTAGGLVKLIPTIILTLIILVLFLVILIQFVLRYLNLYFLFCIYPIVAVFWFNQSTSKFYSEYWKQIITLLIQQPVFLLCFAIFVDMTIGLSTNLIELPNLLIYAVFLGFMTVVPPTLSARIFGDAFAMADHLGFAQSKNYVGQKVNQAKGAAIGLAERGIRNSPKAPIQIAQGVSKAGGMVADKMSTKSSVSYGNDQNGNRVQTFSQTTRPFYAKDPIQSSTNNKSSVDKNYSKSPNTTESNVKTGSDISLGGFENVRNSEANNQPKSDKISPVKSSNINKASYEKSNTTKSSDSNYENQTPISTPVSRYRPITPRAKKSSSTRSRGSNQFPVQNA